MNKQIEGEELIKYLMKRFNRTEAEAKKIIDKNNKK